MFEEKSQNIITMRSLSIKGTLRVVLFVLFITVTCLQVYAQGNLLITPRRVVFEGNKTAQELTLANTGMDTAKYTVSFINYKMTEDGAFEQIETPEEGQFFAEKYLRFFPRTVTLAPNTSQVIRMQYRKGADMQSAEYRSHVYFRAVPNESALGEAPKEADTSAIGIKLTPIFGISIPVIVRNGDLQVNSEISDLALDTKSDTIPILHLTIHRKGDKSVYGDITVTHVSQNGTATEIGLVRGLAVYTPNALRKFKMQLRNTPGVDLTKGKLLIKYAAPNDIKPETYSEKEFLIQ